MKKKRGRTERSVEDEKEEEEDGKTRRGRRVDKAEQSSIRWAQQMGPNEHRALKVGRGSNAGSFSTSGTGTDCRRSSGHSVERAIMAAMAAARRAVTAAAAASASRAALVRLLHAGAGTAAATAPRGGGTRRLLAVAVAAGAATAAVGLAVASADAPPVAHTTVRHRTPRPKFL